MRRRLRTVNFRLPLFTWGEAAGGGVPRLRAVQGQERRASARSLAALARRRLDDRESAHAQGPVSLVTWAAAAGAGGLGSRLTGLEAPFLELDEARSL